MMIYAIILAMIFIVILIMDHLEVMRISRIHTVIFIIIALIFISATYMVEYQQEQKDKAASMEGVLEPVSSGPFESFLRAIGLGNNIIFSTEDNIYPKMELGTSGTNFIFTGKQGPLLALPDDQYVAIVRNRGQVKLSAKLRGNDGLVAEIISNEWKLNPNNLWDRNYNTNMLEVKNEDEVVLQVVVLSDRIQFQGKFYDKNGGGYLIGGRENMFGGIIERRGKGEAFNYVIEPIFKYPSSLHLGELVNN